MSDNNLEKNKEIERESFSFHAELGYCIAAWTGVEMELLSIIRGCFGKVHFETLANTFYAVDSFRSKLAMVDTALAVAMAKNPKLDEWSKKGGLHQRIVAASKKRNNIAHWMVMHLHDFKKPPAVYMMPNIFRAGMKDFKATRPTGGYYVHDLTAIREEFRTLADALQMFWIEWYGPPEMLQLLKQPAPDLQKTPAPKTPTPANKRVRRRSSSK